MGKICIVNLTTKDVSYEEYNVGDSKYHGRCLATYLIKKHTNMSTDRFDDDNVIVLTPGLFTGTQAPSTGRITVATKRGKGQGLQVNNMTGALPQKLASLNIESLVIKGKSENKNTIIYIDKDKVEIVELDELNKKNVPDIIKYIQKSYGENCSLMGTGPTADYIMPLATVFSTYPNGVPEYYCTRNTFGDIWGSKGLKAIVVNSNRFFDSLCFDKEGFKTESKKLAKLIIDNPICGQALPGHGSITLIKLLKSKDLSQFNVRKKVESVAKINKDIKLNKTCAPLCVIGCLNRHCSSTTEMFSAPAESEVNAALIHCYNIEDSVFAKKVNTKAFELGIDSTEFVFTSNIYYKAIGIVPNKDEILNLLLEIEQNTILGKVIGSKTIGVYNLFKENDTLKDLVTKPVINEENNFKVKIDKFFDDFKDLSDLELMYNQIFVLENLGFCIFTSFALINNKDALDIMSKMFYYKTGCKLSPIDMIKFANNCIDEELKYENESASSTLRKNIPEFTKVLYRYFS